MKSLIEAISLYIFSGIHTEDLEIIQEYQQASLSHDPNTIIIGGGLLSVVSGVYFARLMQSKLIAWETDKTSPLPLANLKTISTWAIGFLGLILVFTGALEIFDFSFFNSLIASTFICLLSAISMWRVIENLFVQIDSGEIKEIDEYF